MKFKYNKFKKLKNQPITLSSIGIIQPTPTGIHLILERKKLDSMTIDERNKITKEIKDMGVILHILDN